MSRAAAVVVLCASMLTVPTSLPADATQGAGCRIFSGTFVVVHLPQGPLGLQPSTLYIHDREDGTKSAWMYLENGLAAGYDPGAARLDVEGVDDVPAANDVDCYLGGDPNPVADVLVI